MSSAHKGGKLRYMKGVTYFISDAHLGGAGEKVERRKERLLLSFLDLVESERAGLYILGDLFDFYFEAWGIVPEEYRNVVTHLRKLVRSGVQVHYIVGNHDYWLGDFWQEEVGVSVYRQPLETQIQDRRLFLAHGDGLGNFDIGYEALKRILRNPVNIRLYTLLGPDLGFNIARLISKASRRRCDRRENRGVGHLWRFARKRFEEGFDGVVCGHIHKPTILRDGEKTFLLLGDWMENFSYGKLENGNLSLEYFREEL